MQKQIACKYNTKFRPVSKAINGYTPISIGKKYHSLSTLTCSPNPTIATLINDNLLRQTRCLADGLDKTILFDVADVLRLQHFQNATCHTIGSLRIQEVYKAELTKIAINVRKSVEIKTNVCLT
jgi:hypothetical protein